MWKVSFKGYFIVMYYFLGEKYFRDLSHATFRGILKNNSCVKILKIWYHLLLMILEYFRNSTVSISKNTSVELMLSFFTKCQVDFWESIVDKLILLILLAVRKRICS